MSTTEIGAGIKALLLGTGLFAVVYDGEPKAIDNQTPVAAVMFDPSGIDSKMIALGGKIENQGTWRVRVYLDYASEVAAEVKLRTVVDTLLPLFWGHRTLGGVNGVVQAQPTLFRPAYQKITGIVYRIGDFMLDERDEYFVAPQDP